MKLGASQKGFHFGKIFKPICNREKIIIEGNTKRVIQGTKTREKYRNITQFYNCFFIFGL